tara:strand:- start:8272 stop:8994 length:723 start_codon:yes stop_codon:yes gene_type:complete
MITLNSDINKAFQKTIKELHHCFISKEQIENTFFNFLEEDYVLSEEHKELLNLYISSAKIETKLKIKEKDFNPKLKESELSLACSVLISCFQEKTNHFSFKLNKKTKEEIPEKKHDHVFSNTQYTHIQRILYEKFKNLQVKQPEECSFDYISNIMYEMWRELNQNGLNIMLTSDDFNNLHETMKNAYKNTIYKKNNETNNNYSYISSGILNQFYSNIIIEYEDNSIKLFREKEKTLLQYN